MQRQTNRRLVTIAIMVATFLAAMDVMVVGTAMPTIIGVLGGLALYSWVFSSYLLTSTITVPVYGKLADLFGRKPVFVVGSTIFLVGSALCGTAQTMEQLILFRALQGLGAGAVIPITVTIVGDIYPLEQRARMQGIFAGIWGISSIVGPALGGFITDHIGWRWVFYINLPTGAVAIAMVWLTLHEHVERLEHRIDVAGAVTLTLGVTALMLGLQLGGQELPWTSWPIVGLLGGAVALLALFGRIESRAPEPLLPPALLRHYIIAPASLVAFLTGAVMFAVNSFVPPFVQGVLGGTASTAGLVLAAMSLGWPAGSTVAGRLLLRIGYRVVGLAGTGLILAGASLLTRLSESASLAALVVVMTIFGVGLGFVTASMIIAVQNAVPWSQRGTATSSNQFFRSIGGALGVTVAGAVFVGSLTATLAGLGLPGDAFASANALLDPQTRDGVAQAQVPILRDALAGSLQAVFLVSAAIAGLGVLAASWLPGGRAERHAWQEPPDEQATRAPSGERVAAHR